MSSTLSQLKLRYSCRMHSISVHQRGHHLQGKVASALWHCQPALFLTQLCSMQHACKGICPSESTFTGFTMHLRETSLHLKQYRIPETTISSAVLPDRKI